MRKIKRPKIPQTVVATSSEEQIRRLLAVPERKSPLGFRDYTILMLLFDTGMRLSELSRLKLSNLYLEEGYLQVLGKGSKERLVPLGNKSRKVLWQYAAKTGQRTCIVLCQATIRRLCWAFLRQAGARAANGE